MRRSRSAVTVARSAYGNAGAPATTLVGYHVWAVSGLMKERILVDRNFTGRAVENSFDEKQGGAHLAVNGDLGLGQNHRAAAGLDLEGVLAELDVARVRTPSESEKVFVNQPCRICCLASLCRKGCQTVRQVAPWDHPRGGSPCWASSDRFQSASARSFAAKVAQRLAMTSSFTSSAPGGSVRCRALTPRSQRAPSRIPDRGGPSSR